MFIYIITIYNGPLVCGAVFIINISINHIYKMQQKVSITSAWSTQHIIIIMIIMKVDVFMPVQLSADDLC